MKIRKKILLSNLLFWAVFPTIAESLGKGTVTSVFPRASAQETYVIHSGISNTTCTLKDYVVLKKSNVMAEELLSTLLVAYTTNNSDVTILVEGCDQNNRAIIDAVILE